VAVFQIKYKPETDTTAETDIRPIGIPRDLERPLPYFAMLMELGTEASRRTTGSKIECTPSNVPSEQFQQLRKDWLTAISNLDHQKTLKPTKAELKELWKDVKVKQQAMDSCNRYSIAVRGASSDVYGILQEARIVGEFTTLLDITSSLSAQDEALQHMRPLEHLGNTSSHTDWMRNYVVSSSENSG
jgi:hypothetical protein